MMLEIDHHEIENGVVIVTLKGRIMLGRESEEIEILTAQLLSEGYRKLIFDLADVTHIDSTGVGRFIASYNKVIQTGGQLHMAGAAGPVREAFKITRLDTVFKFFPSVEAAREGLQ